MSSKSSNFQAAVGSAPAVSSHKGISYGDQNPKGFQISSQTRRLGSFWDLFLQSRTKE